LGVYLSFDIAVVYKNLFAMELEKIVGEQLQLFSDK
jgi:hypothetical protein